VSLPPSLVLLGLVQAAVAGSPASGGPAPALVVVALPAEAEPAIIEALNRLRGEATSVGFEVRLVSSASDALSLPELESLWAGLKPAAVVTFARPAGGGHAPHALEVTFLDRGSGRSTVAHLDAGEVAEGQERADVIVAVRAVDFIRARMFDALAGRRVESAPPPPPPPPAARVARFDLAAGLAVLGVPAGFSPSLAPQLAAGYRPAAWLRLGFTAAGFGSEPSRATSAGSVNLAQWFVGATATWLGPRWRRLQPAVELGGGEHWLTVRGDGLAPYTGQSVTLTSLAGLAAAGLAVEILPTLALEARGGTLWLQNEAKVNGTKEDYLGSLGRPLWFGSFLLRASF
jgi:hypothetical protein